MAFLDASNQLVYAKNIDLVEGVDTPISQALLSDHLVSNSENPLNTMILDTAKRITSIATRVALKSSNVFLRNVIAFS